MARMLVWWLAFTLGTPLVAMAQVPSAAAPEGDAGPVAPGDAGSREPVASDPVVADQPADSAASGQDDGTEPAAAADGAETSPEPEPLAGTPHGRDAAPCETEPAPQTAPIDPVREIEDERVSGARPTTVGSFAELLFTLQLAHSGIRASVVDDIPNMALVLAHRFTDRIRFYGVVTLEHTSVGTGRAGSLSVERATLDYRLTRWLELRAGIGPVPMGIVNRWHEPSTYLAAARPRVETLIIPSTWTEAELGIFGEPVDGLRYELYTTSGLNPLGFSAEGGIAGGRQGVSLSLANALAVVLRAEYEPLPGFVFGAAGYAARSGPNAGPGLLLDSAMGSGAHLDVPVLGLSADVRFQRYGLEARAVGAWFSVGETDKLRRVVDAMGTPIGTDTGASLYGAYLEVGYDILSLLRSDHQLVPFVRFERYDTMATLRGRAATPEDRALGAIDFAFGAAWRPTEGVAIKLEGVWHEPDGPTRGDMTLRAAGGVSF